MLHRTIVWFLGAGLMAGAVFAAEPQEPSYTYTFGRGHEQSFGVNAGLLIPIK
jgi:hypothetical protein